MLPAGVIRDADHDDEMTSSIATKTRSDAPEFDDSMLADDDYRGSVGSYDGPSGLGYGDWGDR
jgi:hypothetical protein